MPQSRVWILGVLAASAASEDSFCPRDGCTMSTTHGGEAVEEGEQMLQVNRLVKTGKLSEAALNEAINDEAERSDFHEVGRHEVEAAMQAGRQAALSSTSSTR
eukprot:gnl/TRDRNA2_/TRDRNA2_176945_c0_seq1.p1 gnl/TRDRNA2_/TRDRNA2_176945_c0~~gnl/TRDRNA2_/TRDRNA2_176945_c0_seq1.p1  ORF type:complete len:103 (-),score=23.84 gnl/TRDRNA2_/TRDRNA2_176945_c0_seq1:167-475(-)